ncbi:hypothetical protein E1301_Tti009059 [Triplophysa tibetana]|uniref:Uncharacterized protein n=1 Tax=Triplophysa tibetana TaxID=1572043 RepID=A0A5A9PK66_9TELE|nr:hypothetical protein E1301_Tti009059 [Triplophysa tibetana]
MEPAEYSYKEKWKGQRRDVYASKHSKAYFATEGRPEHKQASMESIMDGSVIYSKELSMRTDMDYDLCKLAVHRKHRVEEFLLELQ